MLTIHTLQKRYGDRIVLDIPELSLQPGIHWFRGGNGSGKTTLFRTVAGLLPFSGEIWLDNQVEINRHPVAYRKRVNYAEAEPVYPGFLSARDLIQFVAKARQAPPGQIDELAERLGLSAYWQQPTSTYSSGMLKKLSLLLAFLGQPAYVLLDEPLTTVDHDAVSTLCALITDYSAQGVSFLLASHQDINELGLILSGLWQVGNAQVTAIEQPV